MYTWPFEIAASRANRASPNTSNWRRKTSRVASPDICPKASSTSASSGCPPPRTGARTAARGCRRAGPGSSRCPATAAPGAPSACARCPSRRPGTVEPPPCRACPASGSRSAPASPARSRTPRPGPLVGCPRPRCLPRRREAVRWCVAAASECPRSFPNDAQNTRFTLTSRWNRPFASPSLRVGQYAMVRKRSI